MHRSTLRVTQDFEATKAQVQCSAGVALREAMTSSAALVDACFQRGGAMHMHACIAHDTHTCAHTQILYHERTHAFVCKYMHGCIAHDTHKVHIMNAHMQTSTCMRDLQHEMQNLAWGMRAQAQRGHPPAWPR